MFTLSKVLLTTSGPGMNSPAGPLIRLGADIRNFAP